MKLNDKKCRNAKPKESAYKLSDGGGLYLYIQLDGAKYWRLKYYYLGKERLLALGVYPTVGLADARDKRDKAKKLLDAGKDPANVKRQEKQAALQASGETFEAVALEWHRNNKHNWSPKYTQDVLNRLEADVFPFIGFRPISEIDPPELLNSVLRKIEKRGSLYVATRMKQICGQIFRYGVATGKCKRDQSADLDGALKTRKTRHFPALTIKEMPEFLTILDKNEARLFARTRRAIRLLMLTFTRTTELIEGKWSETDLLVEGKWPESEIKSPQWIIPPERMKMKNSHIVPLSKQAVEILKEQWEETGHINTPYIFPHQNDPRRTMSNNTILGGIGRMGYKGRMTGHGFRALALSTIKEKLGYRHEVADRQLAHVPRNKNDRAYDRAQFLDERTVMMQKWADYLDALPKKD